MNHDEEPGRLFGRRTTTGPRAKGVPAAPDALVLSHALRARIAGFTAAGYPHETCGLLVGRSDGGTTRVEDLVQARNLNTERAHDRYELDPADLLATDRAARERGLEIVGVWHSHPDHPAVPSATDRDAAWPDWSYLIATVTREGMRELRSWRLDGDGFVEEEISP